jgi:hypothetical protein
LLRSSAPHRAKHKPLQLPTLMCNYAAHQYGWSTSEPECLFVCGRMFSKWPYERDNQNQFTTRHTLSVTHTVMTWPQPFQTHKIWGGLGFVLQSLAVKIWGRAFAFGEHEVTRALAHLCLSAETFFWGGGRCCGCSHVFHQQPTAASDMLVFFVFVWVRARLNHKVAYKLQTLVMCQMCSHSRLAGVPCAHMVASLMMGRQSFSAAWESARANNQGDPKFSVLCSFA